MSASLTNLNLNLDDQFDVTSTNMADVIHTIMDA